MSNRRLLISTLTVLLLAGCAGNTGAPVAGTGTASSGAPTAGSSADAVPDNPTPIKPSERPVKPDASAGARTVTLTGTVTAGVEPGCLVLQAKGGASYLLLFGPGADKSAAPAGAKVTVVGEPQPGMATTCQQGTPFMVNEIQPG